MLLYDYFRNDLIPANDQPVCRDERSLCFFKSCNSLASNVLFCASVVVNKLEGNLLFSALSESI
jgi:hypothetical protein